MDKNYYLHVHIEPEYQRMLQELYEAGHPHERESGYRPGIGTIVERAIRLLYRVHQAQAETEAQALRDAAGAVRE